MEARLMVDGSFHERNLALTQLYVVVLNYTLNLREKFSLSKTSIIGNLFLPLSLSLTISSCCLSILVCLQKNHAYDRRLLFIDYLPVQKNVKPNSTQIATGFRSIWLIVSFIISNYGFPFPLSETSSTSILDTCQTSLNYDVGTFLNHYKDLFNPL